MGDVELTDILMRFFYAGAMLGFIVGVLVGVFAFLNLRDARGR